MAGMSVRVEYMDDWHAVHDHTSKQLHISGTCVVTGGGFHTRVTPQARQGANQLMLLLDITFIPDGESPSRIPIEYQQPWEPDGINYTEVGFEVVGLVKAPPPQPLTIEDAT
jgi:hypothetical protein